MESTNWCSLVEGRVWTLSLDPRSGLHYGEHKLVLFGRGKGLDPESGPQVWKGLDPESGLHYREHKQVLFGRGKGLDTESGPQVWITLWRTQTGALW